MEELIARVSNRPQEQLATRDKARARDAQLQVALGALHKRPTYEELRDFIETDPYKI